MKRLCVGKGSPANKSRSALGWGQYHRRCKGTQGSWRAPYLSLL